MEQEALPEAPPRRAVTYTFKADCTLYLENDTLQRRTIEGAWCAPRPLNRAEWEVQAEYTLGWFVGVLHIHDADVPARVRKHVVHRWIGGPESAPSREDRGQVRTVGIEWKPSA